MSFLVRTDRVVKTLDYYRSLDLRRLAEKVPVGREARVRSEAFQELLTALAMRYATERFTGVDLRMILGEPDAVRHTEDEEVWEYRWVGEHCSEEYRSTTPFLVKNGQVVGVRGEALIPST